MTFYCGIDLHSKKSHVCVIDKDGKKVKEKNLNNDLALILQFLKPFGKDVHIAIESTIREETTQRPFKEKIRTCSTA